VSESLINIDHIIVGVRTMTTDGTENGSAAAVELARLFVPIGMLNETKRNEPTAGAF